MWPLLNSPKKIVKASKNYSINFRLLALNYRFFLSFDFVLMSMKQLRFFILFSLTWVFTPSPISPLAIDTI